MDLSSVEPSLGPIPDDTTLHARRLLPPTSGYLTVGERLGSLIGDAELSRLLPVLPGPLSPEQLLLVSVFQCAEGLADRTAMAAVSSRVDFKYALHLPVDIGVPDESVLCELRAALRRSREARTVAAAILRRLVVIGFDWPASLLDATAARLLEEVGQINGLALAATTMWLTLEAVSGCAAAWLWDDVLPGRWAWYSEARDRFAIPRKPSSRDRLARELGADGYLLLEALRSRQPPAAAEHLPELELLSIVWRWQYRLDEEGLTWRLGDSATVPERRRAAMML